MGQRGACPLRGHAGAAAAQRKRPANALQGRWVRVGRAGCWMLACILARTYSRPNTANLGQDGLSVPLEAGSLLAAAWLCELVVEAWAPRAEAVRALTLHYCEQWCGRCRLTRRDRSGRTTTTRTSTSCPITNTRTPSTPTGELSVAPEPPTAGALAAAGRGARHPIAACCSRASFPTTVDSLRRSLV